ncbi:MAG TPA: hypothetical protein VKW04_03520 [Planctomycetota bacterium]|nr:hypothetical protein [Planctomycetota bacterium]
MLRPAPLLFLALSACAHSPTAEEVEPLFLTIENGNAVQAMAATEKLVAAYDDTHLPRLEKMLDAKPVRALQLISELSSDGSGKLLLSHLSYLLESKDAEVARMAAVASGLRRLRAATAALLHHPEEPSVIRALGRIWEQDLDAGPLPREEEIDRLTVLAVVHRQTMGVNPGVESCEAMLLVMNAAELTDFLHKHAGDKFPSRRLCDEAVRRPGFDPDKGLLIHDALLQSPDVAFVAGILESSPFPLREDLVKGFLKDDRTVREGVRLSDLAAARLKR